MKDFDTKLVAAIRQKRESEGLSIRALSAVVGVSFSTLARIERGDGQPDNNSKIRLLEWLGEGAEEAGLTFDHVAYVHFRAAKNVNSATVRALLKAADSIRHSAAAKMHVQEDARAHSKNLSDDDAVALSKDELEEAAENFRKDLNVSDRQALDSLKLNVEGVDVYKITKTQCIDSVIAKRLRTDACSEWSAMSVPLDAGQEKWAVLLNDCHTVERQRVTILEEYWHILLGHKLTKIARIAEAYGRTYDKAEEHDAYYLASATLLPKKAIHAAVKAKKTSAEIAEHFGTSAELVDYRLKRLGLWREHVGKKVALT